MNNSYMDVTTSDGRTLEVMTGGDPDGFGWLYHSGSPSAAVPFAPIDEAARRLGLRMVTFSRAGYGSSTPRPQPAAGGPGPRVVDDVADSVAILDHLGIEEFVTLGWSGGGPRALACAALLPTRCRAAASLAGVAPYDAEGLGWLDAMAAENVDEYTAAAAGAQVYGDYLTREFLPVLDTSPDELAAAMGDLVTPVDVATLDGDFAAYLSQSFQRAGAQGVVGVRDDGLAAVSPWGFDIADITLPVSIWQGRQDAMVPYAHGAWLAEHVPGAQGHLFEDEGHLSLVMRMEEILADLKMLAGLG